tara:strand:- start:1684 stop:1854 length:171 start_codon:yes stop_codon:yes gene_type:complete
MECVICNDPVYGYGNNPYPVAEEGSCCDDCNMTVVLPERLKLIYNETKKRRYIKKI